MWPPCLEYSGVAAVVSILRRRRCCTGHHCWFQVAGFDVCRAPISQLASNFPVSLYLASAYMCPRSMLSLPNLHFLRTQCQSRSLSLLKLPRRRVPLGLWSRVRTYIRRKDEGRHSSSGSSPSSKNSGMAVESVNQPPPYGDPCSPPKILITPSTPDECEAFSYYESWTQLASTEQVGQVISSQTGSLGACSVDSNQYAHTNVGFRLIL